MMRLKTIFLLATFLCSFVVQAQHDYTTTYQLKLKQYRDKPYKTYNVAFDIKGDMVKSLSDVKIKRKVTLVDNDVLEFKYTLTALNEVAFAFQQIWTPENFTYDAVDFYMPGYWYKKNELASNDSPNSRSSKSWLVREDRLSTPLVAALNYSTGKYMYVQRVGKLTKETLMPQMEGEVMLPFATDMGSLGFIGDNPKQVQLVAQYPAAETPLVYLKHKFLTPGIETFIPLPAGQSVTFKWRTVIGQAKKFPEMMADIWHKTFDYYKPQPRNRSLKDQDIKKIFVDYMQTAVDSAYGMAAILGTKRKLNNGKLAQVNEISTQGGSYINGYNYLDYAQSLKGDTTGTALEATKIIDSYLENIWSPNGLIREKIATGYPETTFTLEGQSQGLHAIFHILRYKREHNKRDTITEEKVKDLLDFFVSIQDTLGGICRKFDTIYQIKDLSHKSTVHIITPLVMASTYFGEPKYLKVAQSAARYVEKEFVSKQQFTSTSNDFSNLEKASAIETAKAFYHLATVVKDKNEQKAMTAFAEKAAIFALSWYYLYDVPFAKGQKLYDYNFKTTGWGLTSADYSQIDAHVAGFTSVLHWLGTQLSKPSYRKMAEVIQAANRDQLLAYNNHMLGMAQIGFMPEVVRQSNWFVGPYGKGRFNNVSEVGKLIANSWEELEPTRFSNFIKPIKVIKPPKPKKEKKGKKGKKKKKKKRKKKKKKKK